MTVLDLVIILATLYFAVVGFRRGFIISGLGLLGFALGALLATWIAGLVLPPSDTSLATPAFGLFGAIMIGGSLAIGMSSLGARLRARIAPSLGRADGLLGAGLAACVALGIAWLLGAVALAVPDSTSLHREVQASATLRGLDRLLPATGGLLHALRPFDPVPALAGPQAQIAAPTDRVLRSHAVQQAEASVVRVLGTACGVGREGTGWVAAPGEVVTAAHVVEGEHDTVVEVGGNPPQLPAAVIGLDTRNDIAVLRVPTLATPALPLASNPPADRAAAILGYPADGPFVLRAGRIGATVQRNAPDANGRGSVSRLLTPLRGLVIPGNSGGPMVDVRGRVVATIVAETFGGGILGGYAVGNAATAHDLAAATAPVASGTCAP
ncbi:MAG TPA: CvpA family protein [Solirubrobacteraceae bacterium]|jgi:S1-C subfamily serine protease|nr:CvpA family protein [Solirubrobacteraceae bacterium]